MNTKTSQKGFTIIELMIATLVFSVILLVVSTGLLNIGRSYFKGITSSATQNTARSIIDDVASAIQFGGGTVYGLGAPGGMYCVGDRLYSYQLGQKLTNTSSHALLSSRVSAGCQSSTVPLPLNTVPSGDVQELLGLNMSLAIFRIEQVVTDPTLYTVNVRVVQGDDDLLEDLLDAQGNPGAGDGILDTCKSGTGSQFCATSEVRTTVHKRLN